MQLNIISKQQSIYYITNQHKSIMSSYLLSFNQIFDNCV